MDNEMTMINEMATKNRLWNYLRIQYIEELFIMCSESYE